MSRFKAAVYLDRDGTVIEERHYLSQPEQVQLIPGAGRAIAALNQAGLAVVLVTNQSGVARGYFPEEAIHAVHARLAALLAEEGARIDAWYYCPHLEEANLEAYRQQCDCRKPAPGMVDRARDALELHGLPSFVVGDKDLDIALGQATGAASILVRTGYGAKREPALMAGDAPPDRVVDALPDAVTWILEQVSAAGT